MNYLWRGQEEKKFTFCNQFFFLLFLKSKFRNLPSVPLSKSQWSLLYISYVDVFFQRPPNYIQMSVDQMLRAECYNPVSKPCTRRDGGTLPSCELGTAAFPGHRLVRQPTLQPCAARTENKGMSSHCWGEAGFSPMAAGEGCGCSPGTPGHSSSLPCFWQGWQGKQAASSPGYPRA